MGPPKVTLATISASPAEIDSDSHIICSIEPVMREDTSTASELPVSISPQDCVADIRAPSAPEIAPMISEAVADSRRRHPARPPASPNPAAGRLECRLRNGRPRACRVDIVRSVMARSFSHRERPQAELIVEDTATTRVLAELGNQRALHAECGVGARIRTSLDSDCTFKSWTCNHLKLLFKTVA